MSTEDNRGPIPRDVTLTPFTPEESIIAEYLLAVEAMNTERETKE